LCVAFKKRFEFLLILAICRGGHYDNVDGKRGMARRPGEGVVVVV